MPFIPILIAFGVGGVAGMWASDKLDGTLKLAMVAGGVYVGGKYVKAW